jgi:hypothetical protein
LAVGVVTEAVSHCDPEVVDLEVMVDMAMGAITEGFKVTGVVVPGMAVVRGGRTPAVLNINQTWELPGERQCHRSSSTSTACAGHILGRASLAEPDARACCAWRCTKSGTWCGCHAGNGHGCGSPGPDPADGHGSDFYDDNYYV